MEHGAEIRPRPIQPASLLIVQTRRLAEPLCYQIRLCLTLGDKSLLEGSFQCSCRRDGSPVRRRRTDDEHDLPRSGRVRPRAQTRATSLAMVGFGLLKGLGRGAQAGRFENGEDLVEDTVFEATSPDALTEPSRRHRAWLVRFHRCTLGQLPWASPSSRPASSARIARSGAGLAARPSLLAPARRHGHVGLASWPAAGLGCAHSAPR